jgi:hypothetical protein
MSTTSHSTVSASISPLTTSVQTTRPRQTPASASQQFRAALANTAGGLLNGVESLSGLVPGGSLVSAAVRTGASAAGPSAEAPAATTTGAEGELTAFGSSADQTMALLQLQERMGREQRQYMAISNAMKARHDTAKNVLGNVR